MLVEGINVGRVRWISPFRVSNIADTGNRDFYIQVEAMVALVIVDALMQQRAQCELLTWPEASEFNPLGPVPQHDLGVVPAAR